MSIELFEILTEQYELYKELEKGINSIKNGEVYSAEEVFDKIEKIWNRKKAIIWRNTKYSMGTGNRALIFYNFVEKNHTKNVEIFLRM